MKISLIVMAVILAPLTRARAQDEIAASYNFGGACSAQGLWTQRALDATHDLMKIINSLKNEPACRGLQQSLASLAANAEREISVGDGNNAQTTDRIQNLPTELSALESFNSSDPKIQGEVNNLRLSKSIQLASSMANFLGAGGSSLDLITLGQRTSRMASRSLDLVDAVVSKLPDLDRCLSGSDHSPTTTLASAVSLLAAFGNSGQGFTSRMADTLYKVSSALRDRKYSQALRRMDQTKLWASLTCLMETTEEDWCSTRDSLEIFHNSIERMKHGEDSAKKELPFNHPLAGYYLLVQEVPVITDWLQKVQIGVDPRLTTDAQFQSSVLDTMNEHIKRAKHAQGIMSYDLATMKSFTGDKKMAVYKLLVDVTNTLIGPPAIPDGNLVNFFLMIYGPDKIPFFLMGDKPVPDEVATNKNGANPIPWDKWILNGNNFRPEFDNPDLLAETIQIKLNELLQRAQVKAIEYFSQWFIVDKNSLVTEGVSGVRYTIEESLQHINMYLADLLERIRANGGDPAVIPNIIDTRTRITAVLASFNEVRALAKEKDQSSTAFLEKTRDAYKHVIDVTYDEFNMLLQRSGFIATRISQLVHYDYTMTLRQGKNLSEYEKEIYIAAGRGLIDRVIQLFNNNPTNILEDMQTAKDIYRRNLLTVEEISRDLLTPYLSQLDMITKGEPPTDLNLMKNSLKRLWEDTFVKRHYPDQTACNAAKARVRKDHPYLVRILGENFYKSSYPGLSKCQEDTTQFVQDNPIRGHSFAWWLRYWIYPDLYPMPIWGRASYTYKDTDGTVEQIKARTCVMTLGFSRWMYYSPFCSNSVLFGPMSPYQRGPENGEESHKPVAYKDLRPDPFLDVDYNKKSNQSEADRICAFRNFNRRNYIFWLIHLRDPYFGRDFGSTAP